MKKEKYKDIIQHKSHLHSPEVEKLMQGKLPFVTCHGITCVTIILIAVCMVLLLTEGVSQQLMRQMIDHTVEHIKSKM